MMYVVSTRVPSLIINVESPYSPSTSTSSGTSALTATSIALNEYGPAVSWTGSYVTDVACIAKACTNDLNFVKGRAFTAPVPRWAGVLMLSRFVILQLLCCVWFEPCSTLRLWSAGSRPSQQGRQDCFAGEGIERSGSDLGACCDDLAQ